MRYVMSDIHGDLKSFESMIKLIELKEDDTLFILGDVVDRGNEPLKTIESIREHKNIICLLGNHEKMAIECLKNKKLSFNWELNGGFKTYEQIVNKGEAFVEDTVKWMKGMPLYYIIEDLKIILIHAGFYADAEDTEWKDIVAKSNEDDFLWARPRESFTYNAGNTGYRYIVGHTPTITIDKTLQEGKILNIGNTTFIDCGNAYKKYGGRLGCIRLDDNAEFYV